MASPDHDVSHRGGDVGPHRHLEDQTDHLLFFCHLSSSVAKHYSHASWSLRSPCGTCCFASNICSSLPEPCGMSCRASCLQRQKPAMFAQTPLSVYRHFTGAVCTTSFDGRFALFSAPSKAAFSVASRLSNSSDILFCASSELPPPWVACCAHQVQNFDLSQRFWCLGFNEQIFRGMNRTQDVGLATTGCSALRCGRENAPTTLPDTSGPAEF